MNDYKFIKIHYIYPALFVIFTITGFTFYMIQGCIQF
jgi:hypothetical protein